VDDGEGGQVTDRHGTEEQLRQEVRELTDLLRTDGSFADLRDVLAARGLLVSQTLLAGLIEGEDEHQYGVFITAGLELVRFEIGRNAQLISWKIVDDPDVLAEDFASAAIGITMKRAGQIS
jgi:hypothetical protein